MKLQEFAQTILFGTQIQEKLAKVALTPEFFNESKGTPLLEIPPFPGRPANLSKAQASASGSKKAAFPSIHRLADPVERGRVLHFFANHELLALELMALMLLRFPEAPLSFRKGVTGILMQEQDHLALYISRMQELGIEFGELPVNDYFWNLLKTMKSPMDFTVQMSLTFEQANLDFSLYFKNLIEKTGDTATTAILERVFQEEIAHVKHGVHWFNQWRHELPQSKLHGSEWEAYTELLPLPLTPQRAKGFEFSAGARRQAGLSEDFIRKLGVYSGSKGRPPTIWLYNPHCDSEIARGKPGFTPPQGAQQVSLDLQLSPIFLCQQQDTVLVHALPRTEYLETLQEAGFILPEICLRQPQGIAQSVQSPKLSGLSPWGWSPETFEQFKLLRDRLVPSDGGNTPFCQELLNKPSFDETGLAPLFSKGWSSQFLFNWLETHPDSIFGHSSQAGQILKDSKAARHRIQELLETEQRVMVKAPYGTSGMQMRRFDQAEDLKNAPKWGWLENTLATQNAIIIEPFLDKIADFSIQLEIQKERTLLLDIRRFMTGAQNEYRGTYLGEVAPGLSPEERRTFFSFLPDWRVFLTALGKTLRKEGYWGPAGVDAMLWKDADGCLRFKPMIELNPRWTMGRVALALEKHLMPGVPGLWKLTSQREVQQQGFKSLAHFAEQVQLKSPPVFKQAGGQRRLASGAVFTNDPSQARSVLTVLYAQPLANSAAQALSS